MEQIILEIDGSSAKRYEFIETVSRFTDCRDKKDNKFLNLAFDTSASWSSFKR